MRHPSVAGQYPASGEIGSAGEDEDAGPAVRGAHAGRSKTAPFRIEPQRGQIPENGSHSPNRVICGVIHVERSLNIAIGVAQQSADVFAEEERRFALADDSRDVVPNPALVRNPAAPAGNAMRLTRPSGKDAIHAAAPRSSIESQHIGEDFGRGEAEAEAPGRFRVAFDGRDGSELGERDFDAKV